MSMTEEQFNEWFDTDDGQTTYYEWLYDNFPELGKHGLFNAMENGDYLESFMEYMGVTE